MMFRTLTLLLFLFFSATSAVVAQTLKDPRTRDEDLSNTRITARTNVLSNGYYEYIYDIQSPADNKGIIRTFKIDVSCAHNFGSTSFAEEVDQYFTENNSKDKQHVPLQAYSVFGFTARLTVSSTNYLRWLAYIEPGKTAKGFRIISPAQPGLREYVLIPAMQTDGWDYMSYDENDPTVMWIDDFMLTGMITGPKCPGGNGRLPGSIGQRSESKAVNNLLSYSAPLKDRFHVDKDTKEIELSIHYSKDIDPKSFKIEPDTIKHLFEPKPGVSQTVMLPLNANDEDTKKIKFRFEARMTEKAMGENMIKPDKAIDKDEFEVRIDD